MIINNTFKIWFRKCNLRLKLIQSSYLLKDKALNNILYNPKKVLLNFKNKIQLLVIKSLINKYRWQIIKLKTIRFKNKIQYKINN